MDMALPETDRIATAAERLRVLLSELGVFARPAAAAERDLSARFGVSRRIIRQALAALEAEGRVWRRQGKGTFPGPAPAVVVPTVPRMAARDELRRGDGGAPLDRAHAGEARRRTRQRRAGGSDLPPCRADRHADGGDAGRHARGLGRSPASGDRGGRRQPALPRSLRHGGPDPPRSGLAGGARQRANAGPAGAQRRRASRHRGRHRAPRRRRGRAGHGPPYRRPCATRCGRPPTMADAGTPVLAVEGLTVRFAGGADGGGRRTSASRSAADGRWRSSANRAAARA